MSIPHKIAKEEAFLSCNDAAFVSGHSLLADRRSLDS
jgi:hypothetical protein